ncbi:proline-rich protein 19 [Mantella aurantiaca]
MNRENCCLPPLEDKRLIPRSAGLESKFTSRDHGKLCEKITNRVMKVKRRKTKKERNGVKFKTQKEIFQKKRWLQDHLQRHDGFSNLHGPKKRPYAAKNKTFFSKQVFITEERLTQHQGIFDHEVKSVNIERFARETTRVEEARIHGGSATNESERRTTEDHVELSHGLIQTPEVKEQEGLPLNPKSSENVGGREVETEGMKTQVSQADPNSQRTVDKENSTWCLQGSGSHLQNTLSGCRPGVFPEETQEAPVHEAAESINNMLSLLKLFPGRNLVREIRQSIMEKVKELSGPSSNQSGLHAQRRVDSMHEADTSTGSLWGHHSERGTSIRSITWRPQGQMQSTPISFMPIPRDCPDHTLLKTAKPEGSRHILSPVLYQPVGSLQRHPLLVENSPRLHTVQLPSERLRPSKQDEDTLTCCRENRHRSKSSLSVNTDSSQGRCMLSDNEFLYEHNTHQKNIKHHADQKMDNQRWLAGQTLQNVSSEQPYTSRPKVRPSSSRESQPSFDDIYNILLPNGNNSPNPQIFSASPLESRVFLSGISFPHSESKNHFESHRNIGHEDHETKDNRFQLEDTLGLRNLKQRLSSPVETRRDPARDFFSTNSSQTWRNINESNDCIKWSSPSTLREANSVVGCDSEWQYGNNWMHRPSHEYRRWRKRPITMPPTSVQQENSFVGPFHVRSLKKEIEDIPSPVAWVYPRMRLY